MKSGLIHKGEINLLKSLQVEANLKSKSLFFQKCRFRNGGTKHDRDINASINIRNYTLGIIDDRYKIKLDKSRVIHKKKG
ncbi:hypothetical protein A0056_001930 [Campylobacter jejuni]|nr:hypothetical protein A0056_005470 [Campylobacter jejuni]QYH11181.1 hypothetical protein A0056_001930 [Campylobacter jejuni]SUW98962.1 ISHa1675 transposase B [Campylobacter jejuni subsp. doylei]